MQIKAFKGYRYNKDVVGDPGRCISPPYDVIDEKTTQQLISASPYNIVRVIRPKDDQGNEQTPASYENAARILNKMLEDKALLPDTQNCIYAYVQDFTLEDQTCQRSGFIALGELKPFGSGVQPHEKTLDGPKADRLKLTAATNAQFGQIFMMYDDPACIAEKIIKKNLTNDPLLDHTDNQQVRHRLYALTDPQDIKAVTDMMADKQAIIADGHHRYETALNYYNQTKNPAAACQMMTFVNMNNPGMIILPTHRLLINLENFNPEPLLEKIKEDFQTEFFSFNNTDEKKTAKNKLFNEMKNCFNCQKNTLGLYCGNSKFIMLTLRDPEKFSAQAKNLSPASAALDVNVLHLGILEKHLGIGDQQLAGQTNLTYIKDIGDAVDNSIRQVDCGSAQAVFFMNPTRMQQIKEVAGKGEKMPQKSTFFYPKIFTGLVINKL